MEHPGLAQRASLDSPNKDLGSQILVLMVPSQESGRKNGKTLVWKFAARY